MNYWLMNLNVQKNVTVLSEPRRDTQKLAGMKIFSSLFTRGSCGLKLYSKETGFTSH